MFVIDNIISPVLIPGPYLKDFARGRGTHGKQGRRGGEVALSHNQKPLRGVHAAVCPLPRHGSDKYVNLHNFAFVNI